MSIADKLQTIAENEQRVYDAGKQAEYDAFWDSFQANGTKTDCSFMFAGPGWNAETLKPKHKLTPIYGASMFASCNKPATHIDFETIKEKFDFSQLINANSMFQNSWIKNIHFDAPKVTRLSNTFNNNDNGSAPNITLKIYEHMAFDNTFAYGADTTVTFTEDSVIAKNGLSLTRQTKMTHDQLLSLINALKDYSTDTSGTTWKVTLGSTNLAKLTSEEIEIAQNKGWYLQ